MGVSGTDVAREAADMVLADDNFATIVAAVEEGRAIFSNIRKFVAYLLSSNAGEVLTLFLGVLIAGWLDLHSQEKLLLPLLAVQILWINLVTDGLPALALGLSPKDPAAMLRPPRPRGEPVINNQVWRLVALVGCISALGTLFLLDSYFSGGFITLFKGHGAAYARTVAFVTLALFQLFNAFNSQRLKRSSLPYLFKNKWLVAAVIISLGMMVAVVHIPALARAFDTEPLAATDWLIAAGVASLALWTVELFKSLSH
jgi:Ca2+-transporting ATPase